MKAPMTNGFVVVLDTGCFLMQLFLVSESLIDFINADDMSVERYLAEKGITLLKVAELSITSGKYSQKESFSTFAYMV